MRVVASPRSLQVCSSTELSPLVPVKHEHVVFCSPSPLQIDLYKLLTQSPEVRGAIRESGKNPLVAIGMFQKLCAHPDLIDLSNIPNVKDILPEGYDPTDRRRELVAEFSGKMLVLERCDLVTRHVLLQWSDSGVPSDSSRKCTETRTTRSSSSATLPRP